MEWEEIVELMPALFEKLQQAPLAGRADVQKSFCFKGGVYVFYENDNALYAGRTKRYIAKRVLIHGRSCSKHNAASFAFLLAKEIAKNRGLDITKTRKHLERDKKFKAIFSKQKVRISKMKIRAVQITDPEVQAVFEIYASKLLGTKYNDFETH